MQKKHIVLYFSLVVLQLIGFVLIRAPLQLVLLAVLLALPIYSVWALDRVVDACSVKFCLPTGPITEGQPVKIQLIVKNPTFNPLFHTTVTIGMRNDLQQKQGAHRITMPLYAHTETKISYPVIPQGEGELLVDSVEIELQDLLGFLRKKKRAQAV
ncbi:MAG: hypothetical protein ACI4HI_10470 [Lachnospiraceae bacterium]